MSTAEKQSWKETCLYSVKGLDDEHQVMMGAAQWTIG